jgi:hypothetical protein
MDFQLLCIAVEALLKATFPDADTLSIEQGMPNQRGVNVVWVYIGMDGVTKFNLEEALKGLFKEAFELNILTDVSTPLSRGAQINEAAELLDSRLNAILAHRK